MLMELRKVGGIVDYYVPHRMEDGYGLSFSGVEQLEKQGTNLLITVDCGINAVEEVDAINETGMEIIITDHHNPKESCIQTSNRCLSKTRLKK